jgi:uncharacterized protein YbjT (DUF2867 family)
MPSSSKTIAIAGVTGKLGTLVATYVLEKTDFTVHGLCRSPEKAKKLLEDHPTRFKVFAINVTSIDDVRKGIAGCNTVICTYNRMENQLMVDSSKILIQACDAEEVARFIPSEYTSDYRALELGEVPLKDAQIQTWMYLRDGNANGTIKVKGAHVLVGIFVEAFYGLFFKIDDPKFWGTGNERWAFVTYESTAEYVAKVATDPNCPTGFLKCKTRCVLMPNVRLTSSNSL